MSDKKRGNRKIADEDLSLFCSQIAMILKSGIPLQDGIDSVVQDTALAEAARIMNRLSASVSAGEPLSMALKDSGVFPEYMCRMVAIGERTGRLDDVLEALAEHYSRQDTLKKSIRSAVVYPLILIVMMSAVIVVLLASVLPVFEQVLRDLGGGDAVGAVRTGTVIAWCVLGVLVLVIMLAAGVFVLSRTRGTGGLAGFISVIPPLRRLSEQIASARFASVLSMMLSGGYTTDEALAAAGDIITDKSMLKKCADCRQACESGVSFPEAVEKNGLFPGVHGRMIAIGVKTGRLEEVMRKLADIYNQSAEQSLSKMTAAAEPAITGILSVMIGLILISVMLPVLNILASIG